MTDTNHIEVLRKRMTELQRLAEYHAQRTADELAGIEREQTAIAAAITALSARASAEKCECWYDSHNGTHRPDCPRASAGEGELRWVVDGRVFGKPTGPDALEYADKNWHADSWSDTRIARLKNIHATPQPATGDAATWEAIDEGGERHYFLREPVGWPNRKPVETPQSAQAQKDESPTITSGGIVEVNPAKAVRYAYQQGNVKKGGGSK